MEIDPITEWVLEGVSLENAPRFQVGEFAELKKEPGLGLGEGRIKVTAVQNVPKSSWHSTGHPQKVEFSRSIGDQEMVYDSHLHQYVLPENLSDLGKGHPTTLSGLHLKKVE